MLIVVLLHIIVVGVVGSIFVVLSYKKGVECLRTKSSMLIHGFPYFNGILCDLKILSLINDNFI